MKLIPLDTLKDQQRKKYPQLKINSHFDEKSHNSLIMKFKESKTLHEENNLAE